MGIAERNAQKDTIEVSDEEYALWEQCPVSETRPPNDGFPLLVEVGDWKPQTREPDYLWQVYSGKSLPSDEQYEPAMADLEALGVPRDLDQETFDGWVRAALTESPLVGFVLEHVNTPNGRDLWDAVCQEWNVADRAAASRLVETVQIWVRRYNPSALDTQ